MKFSKVFLISIVLLLELVPDSKESNYDDDIFGGLDDDDEVIFTKSVQKVKTTRRLPLIATTTTKASRITTARTTSTTVQTKSTTIKQNNDDYSDEVDQNCDFDQKCVRYYLCRNETINTDGTMLIDERLDGPTQEVVSCPSLEVCCTKTSISTKRDLSKFEAPIKCGYRNENGLGGSIRSMQKETLYSQYAEFPWMMAILVSRSVGPVYQCGGSLIHPKVVLTTAHNIAGLSSDKLIVRGGEWDTQSEKELSMHEERKVVRVIIHQDFTRSNLQNDVALLILHEEFELTPFINTVCLPPKNANFDDQRCFSSGWGKTMFGRQGVHQVYLKKVELPIIPSELCQEMLRKTRLGEDFILYDKMLCAGGEQDKDVCTGDGGSPLVCSIPSHPRHNYQAGIVVGGIGCGQKDVPGFYAAVSKYREWIDEEVESLGLETSAYTF